MTDTGATWVGADPGGKRAFGVPAFLGPQAKVTLEIEAEVPLGVPEEAVGTVTENGRTLKFTSQAFEKE